MPSATLDMLDDIQTAAPPEDRRVVSAPFSQADESEVNEFILRCVLERDAQFFDG